MRQHTDKDQISYPCETPQFTSAGKLAKHKKAPPKQRLQIQPGPTSKNSRMQKTKNVKRGVRGVDTWMGCIPWMDKSMHGLATAAVLSKTMLCSSLTPPPQARQRGRRIFEKLGNFMKDICGFKGRDLQL